MSNGRLPSNNTAEKVRALLADGFSGAEIARRLGLNRSTVAYHRRRLGENMDERCRRRYDWHAIQRYHDQGHSVRACRARFGFTSKTWSDAVVRGAIRPRPAAAPIDVYLVAGRRVARNHLKARLLAAGLKQRECEECGIADWRGKPLSLALHHVNGDPLDNRLENLAILCPNCHAQTPNFGALNRRARSEAV